jgi:predicted SnoaL-like aldol condensation-catalyzing enzyme
MPSDEATQTQQRDLAAGDVEQLVLKVMSLLIDPQTAEQARPYLTPTYIQHNPNIASGADAIIEWTRSAQAQQARETMRPAPAPPVFVTQGDRVVMMLPRDVPDPADPSKTYRSYWFDMWRVEDGKLAEHWDGAPKELD